MSKIDDAKRIVIAFPITQILIAVYVAVFVTSIVLNYQQTSIAEYGVGSMHVLPNGNLGAGVQELTRLFTYSFIHISVVHLMLNLVSLAFFGAIIERGIGSKKFITVFMISAVGAAMTHALVWFFLQQHENTFLVGASGAIFGILGCAAARGSKLPYFLIGVEPAVAAIAFAYTGVPVGFVAHIGGFVMGFLVAKLVTTPRKMKDSGPVIASDFSSVNIERFLRRIQFS